MFEFISYTPTPPQPRSYEVNDASLLGLTDVLVDVIHDWGEIEISTHVELWDGGMANDPDVSCEEQTVGIVHVFTDADVPYAVMYLNCRP